MAPSQTNSLIRQLRRIAIGQNDGDMSDGQLLDCFLENQDEAAFEALVRRHGPMVMGVCRRVSNNPHDAEDAFQATFLVLVRRAASIAPRDMVGNWLYGVAYRTALKAKSAAAIRRTKERQVKEMAPSEAPPEDKVWSDLRPLLDRELHRLPDKYRVPVVLCDLEGKTRKEAADQLGWPEGTLSWRLASARALLAKRLTRHGLAFSATSLALVLSQKPAAAVPAPLVVSTVQAATLTAAGQAAAGLISANVAALTEGVLQAMFYTRLKIAGALVLALTVIGTGVAVVSHQVPAAIMAPFPAAHTAQDSFLSDDAVAQRAGAGERQRDERKPADFSGRITALSADGKVLSLEGGAARGEEPKKFDVKLTAQSKVAFVGLLKDPARKLKAGDTAAVWLLAGSKDTAGEVQVHAQPDLAGKILAVSVDGKVLSVETSPQARGEAPGKFDVKLTDKTHTPTAERGGDNRKPEVGHMAAVWLVEGSKDTAEALHVSLPRPDVHGAITAIAADGKELTLESKDRGGAVLGKHTIKLTDKTKIEYVGGLDKQFKVGCQATVWFVEGSADTPALVQVNVARRSPDVVGTISAISADGKTVTLQIQKRGEEPTKTDIKLSDKTILEFPGTDKAEEKKLTVGYQAAVWLVDGSKDTAMVFQAAKPRARGER